MAGTVKVRVRDGWIVYDGTTQRSGGATLDVPEDTATEWETAGWADKLAEPKARRQRHRPGP